MTGIAGWRSALADLSPANFGLVMATGIVALAASMMGLTWIARALFALNVLQYAVLALLYLLRALLYPGRFFGDMANHAVGPGYFTVVAYTVPSVLHIKTDDESKLHNARISLVVSTIVG